MRRLVLLLIAGSLLGPASALADAPANDGFAAATALAVGDAISGTTAGATGEPGEVPVEGEAYGPSCTDTTGNCQRSVWYSVTPAADGPITLSLCGAVAEVFTGSDVTKLGGIQTIRLPGCPAQQTTSWDATAGVRYVIGIAGHYGAESAFSGSLSAAPDTSYPTGDGDTRSPARFILRSPDLHASFECSIDSGAYAACPNPTGFTGLSTGPHTLDVRAVDAGLTDPTPIHAPFVVDDTPPSAAIANSSPSEGGTSGTGGVTLTVTTNEDGSDGNPRYVSCGMDDEPLSICGIAGSSFSKGGYCDGAHTLRVAGSDLAGNVGSPVALHFTVTGHPTCAAPSATVTSVTPGWKNAAFHGNVLNGGSGTDFALTLTGGGASLTYDAATTIPDPTDLQPGTTYSYSLSATSPSGMSTPATGSFTTLSSPPGSATEAVTDVTDHEATLSGSLDPGGNNGYGSWAFLFGPTASYGALAPIGFDFPMGNGPHSFSYRIGGLTSGTVEHYALATQRTDAASALVSVQEPDATFTTSGTAPAGGGTGSTGSTGSTGAPGGDPGAGGGAAGTPVTPGGGPLTTLPPTLTAPPTLVGGGTAKVSRHGSKLVLATGQTVHCPAGVSACAVTANLSAAASSRAAKRIVLATTALRVKGASTTKLTLTLSKAGAKALKKARTLKALLVVGLTASGQKPVVTSRTLKLKAPKGH